jgi:hypothetical protein
VNVKGRAKSGWGKEELQIGEELYVGDEHMFLG